MRIAPLFLLLASPLAPLLAQGWIAPDPGRAERASPAVVRTESNVRVTVDGRIARFEVTERFRNTGRGIAEGTYHYPMPGEAVFSDFSLFQGEQELKGEMMTAEQARNIYEGIVRQLKDPALLTLVGHGLVRAQVFPIQPGETRTVILRYTQLLTRDGDAVRVRYAAGSRGDAPVNMSVELPREAQYATAYSPTHPITETRQAGVLRINVTGPVRGDVDLVLPFRRGLVGGTIMTHAESGEPGFALLFLSPPANDDEAVTIGRDLTFVVDISGSMSGNKMEQARTALRQALAGLGQQDRFRVIAFSSGVRQFREGWTPVNATTVADAQRFVAGLNPNGGTNLAGAIETALAAISQPDRMALVFLMTDGIPSVGESAPDRIAAEAAGKIGRSRIFTFGVGQDVNTYLLDRLAVEGRGSATYVAPGADVSDAVGGVMSKLTRPALVDLRIVSAPVEFIDAAPAVLPDLFFGEELVVLARYRGQGSGPVVIEGTRNGRRERFTIQGNFPRHCVDNDYIPQLWASRRIGELSRQVRLEGSTPQLIASIRDLGLRYGILTEYTSYLVQEPGLVANRPQPVAAPSGAGAAREMTGTRAFEDAKASATMSTSSNLAAADEAVRNRVAQLSGRGEERETGSGLNGQVKRAGGRLLVFRDSAWTDAAHKSSNRITAIAPFSAAWFALVAARPPLAEALAAGSPLILAGDRVSLKVVEGGITEWAPGALSRFLTEFEGR
jgi:Ca-activated chloride channel family protein